MVFALLWQGWGKKGVPSACYAVKKIRSEELQALGHSGQAGRSHLSPWELLLAAFNHVSEIRLQTWWQMPLLGIGDNRNKTPERFQAGHWRKAQPSPTQSCVPLLHFCVQTHIVPATLCGSFTVLLGRCKLTSQGNIKEPLLNEGGFNLLCTY